MYTILDIISAFKSKYVDVNSTTGVVIDVEAIKVFKRVSNMSCRSTGSRCITNSTHSCTGKAIFFLFIYFGIAQSLLGERL